MHKVALESASSRPLERALSVLFTFDVRTRILGAFAKLLNADSVVLVIKPLAVILRTTLSDAFSDPRCPVLFPLACVNVSVEVYHATKALPLVIYVVPFIAAPIWCD